MLVGESIISHFLLGRRNNPWCSPFQYHFFLCDLFILPEPGKDDLIYTLREIIIYMEPFYGKMMGYHDQLNESLDSFLFFLLYFIKLNQSLKVWW